MSQKLSLAIPCFNESKNIQIVLDQLSEISKNSDIDLEVIVIDGGSTDNTQAELKLRFQDLPGENFKLVLRETRGGYGNDIMEALSHASGDVLSWTHADLQTDPSDVVKAYDLYKKNAQGEDSKVFVKGVRKNRRLLEAFFSFGMELVSWLALRVYLTDINAQPKMFSRKFYEKYLKEGHPGDFSLDLYALYLAKINGYKIYTLPVYFKKRIHGEAKGGGGGWKMRINLIKRTFRYIFKLRRKVLA